MQRVKVGKGGAIALSIAVFYMSKMFIIPLVEPKNKCEVGSVLWGS